MTTWGVGPATDPLDPDGDGLVNVPAAPGRLGEPLPLVGLADWVGLMARWRDRRHDELSGLDAAALRSQHGDGYTGDVVLAMSLWQAASDRVDELLRDWASGSVDDVTRERMARTVHARHATAQGMPLSLVETCRLCDVLVAQLRARLALDPTASDTVDRVLAMRAATRRLEALARQAPDAAARVDDLCARVEVLARRASLGGDVAPEVAGLEAEVALAERDLIVATARARRRTRDAGRQEHEARARAATAALEQDLLVTRGLEVATLAARTRAEVAPDPAPAVPDPATLGPVPTDGPGAVDDFVRRQGAVRRALDAVEADCRAALARLDDVRRQWDAYEGVLRGNSRADDPEVAAARQRARDLLGRRPCDVAAAGAAVLEMARAARRRPRPDDGGA